jgi:hypothetical protein
MKDSTHIRRFNESEENLNSELSKGTSSSISSDGKKEIYNFLLWLRKNHKFRQFEVSGELRFQDVLSDKEYSFDEIYDFYKS